MSEPSKRQLAPHGLSLVLELRAGTARTAESCYSVSQHGTRAYTLAHGQTTEWLFSLFIVFGIGRYMK